MRVRASLVIVSLLALSACTMWKENQGKWSGATGGEQIERLWWEDLKAKRFQQLEQLVDAAYTGVTPAGVLDRAGLMQHLRQLEITDYTLGDFTTQSNGPDLVVTYRATVKGKEGGRPLDQRVRYLSIWQHTKHGWIRTAQSVTPDEQP